MLNRRNDRRGNASNVHDLDRLFDTIKRKRARSTFLASARTGESAMLGEITERHFDATFDLNRGPLCFPV
jgi:hypothetical protein